MPLVIPSSVCYIRVTHDRPGDKLRKQCNICREIDGIPLRRHTSPVYIHLIAKDLERVKADTDGEHHAEQRNIPSGQRTDGGEKKVRVFAVSKQSEADSDGKGQNPLRAYRIRSVFLEKQSGTIARKDGEEHENDEFRLSPRVKKETCGKEDEIFPAFGCEKIQ